MQVYYCPKPPGLKRVLALNYAFRVALVTGQLSHWNRQAIEKPWFYNWVLWFLLSLGSDVWALGCPKLLENLLVGEASRVSLDTDQPTRPYKNLFSELRPLG